MFAVQGLGSRVSLIIRSPLVRGGPHNKDYSISGFIMEVPLFKETATSVKFPKLGCPVVCYVYPLWQLR